MKQGTPKNIIIGRKAEQQLLKDYINSPRAEMIAVYGRRRVGKTYLIRNFFNDKFDFYMTGMYKMGMRDQLQMFADRLSKYAGHPVKRPKNWFRAFEMLRDYLMHLPKRRWIVFIDELPWLDTPKSKFFSALEAFWNLWGSNQPQLKLIVCGSATSWMINKLLGDKGGLHNRVTHRLRLCPFTLAEVETYLKYNGINWDRMQVLQCYMVMGGVPYYLSQLNRRESLTQNIDRLFFGKMAELREEYAFLFRSLFQNSVLYQRVAELLAAKPQGLTRAEIIHALKLSSGGGVSEVLENLCRCDIAQKFATFGMTVRQTRYRLADNYVAFYLHFVKDNNSHNSRAWREMKDQKRSAWYGHAFELVCFAHIDQIKRALGIPGIESSVYGWSYRAKNEGEKGAQIDLLIERADRIINLCEMKYSIVPFELTGDYYQRMVERRELFRTVTHTTYTLQLTMVTTMGLKDGKYTGNIASQVDLDDLFTD